LSSNPEQLRLRRVFDKPAHGHLEKSRMNATLTNIRPSAALEDTVFNYKREMAKCRKLREVPFKGTSMTALFEHLSRNVLDDMLEELTEELDSIFNEYAEKFIGEI
jgi:hypothetical protein